jgi:hypothetical protein
MATKDTENFDRVMDGLQDMLVMEATRRLRELLMELYVSGVLWQDRLSEPDQKRLLDTVLAAAEGRPFEPPGLPFPASRKHDPPERP